MDLVEVARFDPPRALDDLEAWKQRHADRLRAVPVEDVAFDIGRAAAGGDFARVRIAPAYANLFLD